MKKKFNYLLFLFLTPFAFTSCDDNPEPVLSVPTIENVEIGSGNNHIGVIGRDFHLNADIVAGSKIDLVQVKIEPIAGETYAGNWSFELTWEQFKGAKNTNVHKHFDIPADAVAGKYDFILIVTDENGTSLEERAEIKLVAASDLEVDPILYIWMITTDQGDFHYVNEELVNPENVSFDKNEVLKSDATIKNVKGDGEMYLLLIRKELNHRPESVDAIDFSKVIVYDTFSHENEVDVDYFANVIYEGNGGFLRAVPEFKIGSPVDNNVPVGDLTSGENAWQSGDYYFAVVYTNSTYDISLHHYFDLEITGF